jgi:hypothetical protein
VNSTSTTRATRRRVGRGFTILELLIGVTLAACVAVALAPVWLSWQRVGGDETDLTIWFAQSRVAVARFERDLRLAGAARCPFPADSAVLEATPTQVVFLENSGGQTAPLLVEWDLSKGALMRRWAACPGKRPVVFAHNAYLDSKTMLEDVRTGSRFLYQAGSRALGSTVDSAGLSCITSVTIEVMGGETQWPGVVRAQATAAVGR